MTAAARIVAVTLVFAAAAANAQPAVEPGENGFIGKGAPRLEIDDCPVGDPTATEAQLSSRFDAVYARGQVLYAQGDYLGAVRELLTGYCLVGELAEGKRLRYKVLKDIGQAHERNLDYEKAIAYFERYVRDFPDAGDQTDKHVVEGRILVLQKLRAQILVESSPGGAAVTISDASGVAGLGTSGKPIDVIGGAYTMRVELEGYEPYTKKIEVRIGKPFAYFAPLVPLHGRLSVQVSPGDARVFLRDKAVERFVGIGRVDEVLPVGDYVLIAEASDRLKQERRVEVLPNRVNLMQLDLPPRPQFGRRQLVVFSTAAAASATGGLLAAFENPTVTSLGVAGGAAIGLFGSYLYLPDQVPLGTSNLTFTAGVAGTIAGVAGGLLFTDSQRIVPPAEALTTLAGAGIGYYVGSRTDVSVGDAALFNSCVLWGTSIGGLFALSFDGDRRISSGLVLSGLGMGVVGGTLMGRYFEISRRHAALIDIGGLAGAIVGLAAESFAYPTSGAGDASRTSNEHAANFVLGGVSLGLLGAGFLTRNIDTAKVPVKPTIGTAATASGAVAPLYGISGTW